MSLPKLDETPLREYLIHDYDDCFLCKTYRLRSHDHGIVFIILKYEDLPSSAEGYGPPKERE